MMLDRKKINKLTRWSAIILAVVFLLSFVLLGVGSSSMGSVFSGCSGSGSINSSSSFEDREAYYKQLIEENPQDDASMLQLANLYSADDIARYQDAIDWFNSYLELKPNDVNVRIRIANIYLNDLADADSAVAVMTEATTIAPDNPDGFYMLGLAQRQAGQNQAAILSWNKYLELAPDSSNADLIRREIEKLEALPPTSGTETTIPGTEGIQVPQTPAP
jgi:tetratricopeptide (TPR) repeat protein